MTDEPDGKCQVYYGGRGSSAPPGVKRCRKRAVAVIDGMAVCAMHAPKLLRITNQNAEALADLWAAGIVPEQGV